MDIICAPYVQRDEIDLLRILIVEYLQMHVELFPTETLKNKHHHLIHYPRLIVESGPLSRLWCLRFESKQQRSKKLIHLGGNFKNVPRSIAMRHRLDMTFTLMSSRGSQIPLQNIDVGPGQVTYLHDWRDGIEVDNALG
jgi:hypothetical protein